VQERPSTSNRGEGEASTSAPESIARMSTEEWRTKFEQDGTVDLWLEDEFNAGSRLVVSGCPRYTRYIASYTSSAADSACSASRG
jgi:ferredoxin